MKTPYPVQQAHIGNLVAALNSHGAALDSSMTGCGKTLAAVEVARISGRDLFVVCPKAVIPAWEREMADRGVRGVVINYEKLKTGKKYGHWDKKKWVWDIPEDWLVVLDEVHKCQNPSSQNCKMAVAAKGRNVLMLSATVADDPTELRAVGYLLGLFELPKYWNWCKAHGCYINPWGALEYNRKKTAPLEKIHAQIYPDRGSRMTIDDMRGHFAENLIVDDPIDFGDDGAIAKIYAEMDAELDELKREMADDSSNPAAKALVAQLRARQAVELLKVPTIVDVALDHLDEGKSVVIYLNFDASIEAIKARLDAKKIEAGVIRGGQSPEDRLESMDRFQANELRAVLCNLAAGGVGISLHDTDGNFPRVSLISPSFDAKVLVQALGRIHRAGGKSPAYQRLMVAGGTIEEKVVKAAKQKIVGQEILNAGKNTLNNSCTPRSDKVSHNTEIPEPKEKLETKPAPNHSERPHAEHSPSSLKYFEICGSYKGKEGDNWASGRGTRIHEALEHGDITLLKDDEEQAIATKCFEYVEHIKKAHGTTKEFREILLDIDLLDGEKTYGTCDLLFVAGTEGVLVDYKTGYGAIDDAEVNCQAWAYSLGALQKLPELEKVTFYFLMPVRDEVSHATFTRDMVPEMKLRLTAIIARAKAGGHFNAQPEVCTYCGNKANCKALAEKAFLVANRYTEGFKLPKNTARLDDINNPETLALLLKLAPIMESWAEDVKKLSLEKSLNEGWNIPGFRLTERKTPRAITSALLAYEAVKDTVQLTDFLAACSKVSVPDLEKFYSDGLPRGKKGQGRQEMVDKLTDAGVLRQEGVVHVLRAEKA